MDYAYDHEQRLVEAVAYQANHQGKRNDREVVRLLHDGLGRRLAKEYIPSPVSGEGQGGGRRTKYVYDGLDPIGEYSLWNGQRIEYHRGAGARLLTLRHFPEGTEGQSYWYAYDGRGNVAGLTKDEGQSTHDYRYDAYGQLLPARGNASTMLSAGFTDPHNHHTFGGKEWEEYLSLYEFGYRLYDPWAGIWLTQDLLRGQPARPRTLHRYAYAFASPITYYDAYGLNGQVGPTPTPEGAVGDECYTCGFEPGTASEFGKTGWATCEEFFDWVLAGIGEGKEYSHWMLDQFRRGGAWFPVEVTIREGGNLQGGRTAWGQGHIDIPVGGIPLRSEEDQYRIRSYWAAMGHEMAHATAQTWPIQSTTWGEKQAYDIQWEIGTELGVPYEDWWPASDRESLEEGSFPWVHYTEDVGELREILGTAKGDRLYWGVNYLSGFITWVGTGVIVLDRPSWDLPNPER